MKRFTVLAAIVVAMVLGHTQAALAYGQCGGAVFNGAQIYVVWQNDGIAGQIQGSQFDWAAKAGFHRMDESGATFMAHRTIRVDLPYAQYVEDFGCKDGQVFSVGKRLMPKGTPVLVVLPANLDLADVSAVPRPGFVPKMFHLDAAGKGDCSNPLAGSVWVRLWVRATKTTKPTTHVKTVTKIKVVTHKVTVTKIKATDICTNITGLQKLAPKGDIAETVNGKNVCVPKPTTPPPSGSCNANDSPGAVVCSSFFVYVTCGGSQITINGATQQEALTNASQYVQNNCTSTTTTPPPTCTNPAATNYGGALPCVLPPPKVAPTCYISVVQEVDPSNLMVKPQIISATPLYLYCTAPAGDHLHITLSAGGGTLDRNSDNIVATGSNQLTTFTYTAGTDPGTFTASGTVSDSDSGLSTPVSVTIVIKASTPNPG